MASEAVQQLGGRLWVESNAVDAGTTISFSLGSSASERGFAA
jgi:signal transduction histidine kinase